MEYPVCLRGSRVGTLYVRPAPESAELRAACAAVPRGLYRLYLCGSGGEVLLGVTEDGALRRRFSRELLSPAGDILRGELRVCAEDAPPRPGFLSRLPPSARLTRRAGCTEVTLPFRAGDVFPLPELFCFALPGQDTVRYLFDGAGRPVMPKI